jgi:putative ABC transport system substrate-binding protein
MKRRQFITLLGGARAAWPLAATAQQQPAIPVVGYIGENPTVNERYLLAFRKGLNESGYIEGRNVAIEYRWVEGQNDRPAAFVSDFVSRRVSVIAAVTSPSATLAAKAATQTIPIVFRIGDDPVAGGFVASLNRPGGNLTGITTLGGELGPKRLQILRELLPAGAAVALLVNPTSPSAAAQTKEIQAAAQLLGVRLVILNASSPREIDAAFASVAQQDIKGLLTNSNTLFFTQRDQLVALVARRAIPAVYSDRIAAIRSPCFALGFISTAMTRSTSNSS